MSRNLYSAKQFYPKNHIKRDPDHATFPLAWAAILAVAVIVMGMLGWLRETSYLVESPSPINYEQIVQSGGLHIEGTQ